jgi:mannitol/fructose-specific phosphotransferase system IIA component
MKKILSLVLVIALVLGSFSFAFAAAPADVVDTDYEEAVETLMALGVINGYPDGTYRPANVVTRAEMAKLLIYILGYSDLASGTAGFSDTAGHWAEGTIGLAAGIGLVQGYPDGSFKPDATVTFDEAITMIVRALGYTDESLKGTWPTNYKIKAIDLSLLKDVSVAAAGANRGAVAMMLYNALEAKYGEVDTDGNWVSSGKDLVSKVGLFVENEYISYEDVYDEDDALDTAIDLAPYLYHVIDYYENADGDIAYVSNIDTDALVGTVTAVSGTSITVKDADDDETDFVISTSTPLFFNGEKASSTDATELSEDGNCEVVVIYDEDDVVKGIIAEQYYTQLIDREYKARTPMQIDGIQLPITEDDDDDEILDADAVTVVGDADGLQDIESEDLVYVYAADNQSDGAPAVIKLLVVRDTFEGKVTEIDTDDEEVVVGGKVLEDGNDVVTSILAADLGTTIKVFLDKDGDVYDWTTELDADDDVTYAIFIGIDNGSTETDVFTGDLSIDDYPRIKLLTESGDQIIYNLDSDGIDLEDSSDYNDLGDLIVEYDLSITTDAAIETGYLVVYEVNSDGFVDFVELADMDAIDDTYTYDDDDATMSDSYFVTSNTVIFDLTDENTSDWDIATDSVLGENGTASYIYTSSYNLEVVVVTDSDAGDLDDNTYAIITKITLVYDDNDQVQKLKAFVDGEIVYYLTEEIDSVSASAINEVVTLTLDDGVVEGVEAPDSYLTGQVDEVLTSKIRVDGMLKTLSSDVVIYVIEADGDVFVGDMTDIFEDDYVMLVDTDSDTDEYEIVVVDLTTPK